MLLNSTTSTDGCFSVTVIGSPYVGWSVTDLAHVSAWLWGTNEGMSIVGLSGTTRSPAKKPWTGGSNDSSGRFSDPMLSGLMDPLFSLPCLSIFKAERTSISWMFARSGHVMFWHAGKYKFTKQETERRAIKETFKSFPRELTAQWYGHQWRSTARLWSSPRWMRALLRNVTESAWGDDEADLWETSSHWWCGYPCNASQHSLQLQMHGCHSLRVWSNVMGIWPVGRFPWDQIHLLKNLPDEWQKRKWQEIT